jgi:hypothetical protein
MGDGPVRRVLTRVVNDDNLDLYLLGTVALVFTVLGITGISDVKTTSAVVVALLALLAFSQIRSRKLLEQIHNERHGGATALFARDFSTDLIMRRRQAHDLLLAGDSMSRTVNGMRPELAAILRNGGRIRVLVLDPTDEALIKEAANRRIAHTLGPDKLRARITNTLDDLTALREQAGGRLEIRVSSAISSAGFNCLDMASLRGLVSVQHYEYQPEHEAAPIFTLAPSDGEWYHHFVDEAERLWAAGTEWPLSPEAAVARASRPVFREEFGPELDAAIDSATDLLITGIARNSMVNSKYRWLERKLQAGDRFRFLLIDPDSTAADTAAGRYHIPRTPESVRDRVTQTLRLLSELKAATGGDLVVRLTPYPISMGMYVTDAALFAEYFTYRGSGNPKLVLQPGDGDSDYALLRGEAEKLWASAQAHQL